MPDSQPETSSQTRPLRNGRRGYSKLKRRAIRVLAALVLVGSLAAGASLAYGQFLFSKVHRVVIAAEKPQVAGQPINILLIGNNSRAGLSPSEAAAFGTQSQVGGGRADVSMIAHFDPTTKQVSLLSIPRDLFMPIPGTTKAQRVDAALNPISPQSTVEDPNRLVKTIQDDLGIPIQHYVELNFDTFQGVVNALGGIKMYFPTELKDSYSSLNITTTGCLTLNGYQALQVVRARHLYYRTSSGTWLYDGLGDLSRTRRDHIFIQVLSAQVKAAGIGNPVRDLALLNSIYKDLTLDSHFSESELLSLIRTYASANPANAPTGTLPIAFEGGTSGYVFDGVNYSSIVFPQEPADTLLMDQTLGISTPKIAPSDIAVTVINGSHTSNTGANVANQLRALGYNVGAPQTAPATGNPAESVIYYTPGNIQKAEVLRASLAGSVIMGELPSITSGTPLELVAGDQIAVGTISTAAAPSNIAAPSTTTPGPQSPPPTKPTSTTVAAHASVAIPNITQGTQINVLQQPEPWDPRACPA